MTVSARIGSFCLAAPPKRPKSGALAFQTRAFFRDTIASGRRPGEPY